MELPKDYKPHWKGPAPIPDPELRARPRGGIQWQCPDCGNLHSQDKQFWKLAKIQCARLGCRHKFRVGVGFQESLGGQTEGCLMMGQWTLNTANRLNPAPMYTLPGRLFGMLDWECPKCFKLHTSDVSFFDFERYASCKPCGIMYSVQLLIYRPAGSKKAIVPFDWTPYAPETSNSIPPT